ncbi:MAG TPA: hypothetical protein VF928_09320 [Usitatibacteraceae bacterium]
MARAHEADEGERAVKLTATEPERRHIGSAAGFFLDVMEAAVAACGLAFHEP